MNFSVLQKEVRITSRSDNIQGLTQNQINSFTHLRSIRQYRNFKSPIKFNKTFPLILKDEFYKFQQFHHVDRMESSHFQSKYTLCTCGIPNLILHSLLNQLIIYDTSERTSYTTPLSVESLGITSQDKICAVAGMGGEVLLIDLLNGKQEKHIVNPKREFINHIVFYNQYLITNDNGGNIKIIDFENNMKEFYQYKDKEAVNLTSVNQEEQLAYCGDRKGLFVLDPKSNTLIHSLEPHSEFGFGVAFNPVKSYELASCSEDSSTVIYDLRYPKDPLQQFLGKNQPIYNITYQNEGKYLFIAENYNQIHILNSINYDKVQSISFYGEISGITNCQFDQDTVYLSINTQNSNGIAQFKK